MPDPPSPTFEGLPPPTGEHSPLGDGGTPIPPPAAPSGLPPLHRQPTLTKKEESTFNGIF